MSLECWPLKFFDIGSERTPGRGRRGGKAGNRERMGLGLQECGGEAFMGGAGAGAAEQTARAVG